MDTICAYTRITDTGSRNQINESFSYCEWYILCVHVLYIICDVVFVWYHKYIYVFTYTYTCGL